VVQQTAGPWAGSPVGSVASPLACLAFLERDCKRSLGQLDAKQIAGGDGYAALGVSI
jgi:hypothetical protein